MSVNNEALIGLFFEVTPHPGHSEHYFSFVEMLKPELANYEGLLWLNRYRALFDDYSLLSHQLWDSEQSIENWRKNKTHRLAQTAGIKTHFKDYRIRIGKRLEGWLVDDKSELEKRSPGGSSSLLLSVQSNAPILDSIPEGYGSSQITYADLEASKQFITLLEPNDLLHAKALGSSINADIIDKIELFLIGRNYSMTERDQAPSQKPQKPQKK
jgi:heme-degrading monooxygenase HmoA